MSVKVPPTKGFSWSEMKVHIIIHMITVHIIIHMITVHIIIHIITIQIIKMKFGSTLPEDITKLKVVLMMRKNKFLS